LVTRLRGSSFAFHSEFMALGQIKFTYSPDAVCAWAWKHR